MRTPRLPRLAAAALFVTTLGGTAASAAIGGSAPAGAASAPTCNLNALNSHKGLVKALHTHFAGASWQRCQTHLTRNILASVTKTEHDAFHKQLRRLFEASDEADARKILAEIMAEFGLKAPKAVACLESGFDDAIAVFGIPEAYRKRLRTTNSQERLNEEIRRREKVIRIFPNENSAIRLMGAILMEHHEAWSCGKKYFDMAAYWESVAGRAGNRLPAQPTEPACMRNVTIERE